jgi:hypothetical protein
MGIDKEKVAITVARVVLILQQRDFSAAEINALIHCLQKLLEEQCKKHGIEPWRGEHGQS